MHDSQSCDDGKISTGGAKFSWRPLANFSRRAKKIWHPVLPYTRRKIRHSPPSPQGGKKEARPDRLDRSDRLNRIDQSSSADSSAVQAGSPHEQILVTFLITVGGGFASSSASLSSAASLISSAILRHESMICTFSAFQPAGFHKLHAKHWVMPSGLVRRCHNLIRLCNS